MHALTRRSFARTSLLSFGALTAVTACSSADGNDPSAASDGSWPRTVTLGNSEISLDAAPQRIVAVSTETGDLALELVGPERMAGVVEGAQDPSSANQSELAQQVEDTVVGAPSRIPSRSSPSNRISCCSLNVTTARSRWGHPSPPAACPARPSPLPISSLPSPWPA